MFRNKSQIIKKKLLSTYQYSKHKRGKNPFKMLLSGANDKKEKSETIVDKILIKNANKRRASTFNYMTPIKNLQRKEKNAKKIEEHNSNEISTVLPNTGEKDRNFESNETNGKPNFRSKSSMSCKRINEKHENIEKTNFYKKVNSAIINRCSGMIQEGDNLKRFD